MIRSELLQALASDNPDDTRADITALLLTGRTAEELEGGQAGQATELAALSLLAGQVTGRLSQQVESGLGTTAIRVEPNQRVRVWVMDDGPSENSSFHVIGTIFDTVYKEGAYLLRPNDPGGSQALDLQPAQGGFVEFTLEERGLYPLLTHKLASASKGALGYFQAGEPREGTGGHGGH